MSRRGDDSSQQQQQQQQQHYGSNNSAQRQYQTIYQNQSSITSHSLGALARNRAFLQQQRDQTALTSYEQHSLRLLEQQRQYQEYKRLKQYRQPQEDWIENSYVTVQVQPGERQQQQRASPGSVNLGLNSDTAIVLEDEEAALFDQTFQEQARQCFPGPSGIATQNLLGPTETETPALGSSVDEIQQRQPMSPLTDPIKREPAGTKALALQTIELEHVPSGFAEMPAICITTAAGFARSKASPSFFSTANIGNPCLQLQGCPETFHIDDADVVDHELLLQEITAETEAAENAKTLELVEQRRQEMLLRQQESDNNRPSSPLAELGRKTLEEVHYHSAKTYDAYQSVHTNVKTGFDQANEQWDKIKQCAVVPPEPEDDGGKKKRQQRVATAELEEIRVVERLDQVEQEYSRKLRMITSSIASVSAAGMSSASPPPEKTSKKVDADTVLREQPSSSKAAPCSSSMEVSCAAPVSHIEFSCVPTLTENSKSAPIQYKAKNRVRPQGPFNPSNTTTAAATAATNLVLDDDGIERADKTKTNDAKDVKEVPTVFSPPRTTLIEKKKKNKKSTRAFKKNPPKKETNVDSTTRMLEDVSTEEVLAAGGGSNVDTSDTIGDNDVAMDASLCRAQPPPMSPLSFLLGSTPRNVLKGSSESTIHKTRLEPLGYSAPTDSTVSQIRTQSNDNQLTNTNGHKVLTVSLFGRKKQADLHPALSLEPHPPQEQQEHRGRSIRIEPDQENEASVADSLSLPSLRRRILKEAATDSEPPSTATAIATASAGTASREINKKLDPPESSDRSVLERRLRELEYPYHHFHQEDISLDDKSDFKKQDPTYVTPLSVEKIVDTRLPLVKNPSLKDEDHQESSQREQSTRDSLSSTNHSRQSSCKDRFTSLDQSIDEPVAKAVFVEEVVLKGKHQDDPEEQRGIFVEDIESSIAFKNLEEIASRSFLKPTPPTANKSTVSPTNPASTNDQGVDRIRQYLVPSDPRLQTSTRRASLNNPHYSISPSRVRPSPEHPVVERKRFSPASISFPSRSKVYSSRGVFVSGSSKPKKDVPSSPAHSVKSEQGRPLDIRETLSNKSLESLDPVISIAPIENNSVSQPRNGSKSSSSSPVKNKVNNTFSPISTTRQRSKPELSISPKAKSDAASSSSTKQKSTSPKSAGPAREFITPAPKFRSKRTAASKSSVPSHNSAFEKKVSSEGKGRRNRTMPPPPGRDAPPPKSTTEQSNANPSAQSAADKSKNSQIRQDDIDQLRNRVDTVLHQLMQTSRADTTHPNPMQPQTLHNMASLSQAESIDASSQFNWNDTGVANLHAPSQDHTVVVKNSGVAGYGQPSRKPAAIPESRGELNEFGIAAAKASPSVTSPSRGHKHESSSESLDKNPSLIDATSTNDTSTTQTSPSLNINIPMSAPVEVCTTKWIVDPYGDQGEYEGQILTDQSLPHGTGTMNYIDGRVYSGEWKIGHWHGEGSALFANGDVFEGQYHEDQRHGYGVYAWKDGRVYAGDFCMDQRQGHGKYTWPDGANYEGEFQKGLRHGDGRYTFKDGSVYMGEWSKGKYHGFGECHWADGRIYKGEWYHGKAHGQGVEIRPDGSIRHDGKWENDAPIRSEKQRRRSNPSPTKMEEV